MVAPLLEAQAGRKQGGWLSFPFIIGSVLGLGLAVSGSTSNFIVYLIKEYNVGSIDAAQISNIVNGCTSISLIAGAILSDSFFGCYPVVAFSTLVSLLSTILFTLTATLPSLRPSPREKPSPAQLAVLYSAVALIAVGSGGTRFNMMTMGANQFDEAGDQEVFFNWYFIVLYATAIAGSTVIVYVQDSVSWGLGFGLCVAANAVAAAVLLLGTLYYRRPKAEGSPFTDLARVVVAALRKGRISAAAMESASYYSKPEKEVKASKLVPTMSFRWLNRAAVIINGDTHADGSVARPWRLCSVEQVEDLKTLIRLSPLWSSSIFLSVSIGVQASLSVLQALTMDRSLGRHFAVPAASLIVSSLAATAIVISLLDRALFPTWSRLTGHSPTPLQRIGLGHVLNAAAMAVSAAVERARSSAVRANSPVVPMSALWLVVPFAVTGAGEALHFPGQVTLYYQEFPRALRSTATGMIALIVAIGFYLSTAAVDILRRLTAWLPDDINESRMENVYWLLAGGGVLNFGYYVLCASLYKYRLDAEKEVDADIDN